jgi:hypothetical protein
MFHYNNTYLFQALLLPFKKLALESLWYLLTFSYWGFTLFLKNLFEGKLIPLSCTHFYQGVSLKLSIGKYFYIEQSKLLYTFESLFKLLRHISFWITKRQAISTDTSFEIKMMMKICIYHWNYFRIPRALSELLADWPGQLSQQGW